MPLATPVIVQQVSVSVTVAPGSDPLHPVGYNVLTLPKPVTVGNQIIFIGFGGGAANPWFNGFGNTLPPGWAILGGFGGVTNAVQTTIYGQTAVSPVPPSAAVAFSGLSSQCGILMEIANCGTINFVGSIPSTSLNVATVPQQGSVEAVASLYLGVIFGQDGNGFTYSNPEPPGASLGANMSVVILFEGSVGWGTQISCASNNPVTFGVMRSATITSGIWYAGLAILAGEQTVGPPVPPENLAQPVGTQDVVYTVVERIAVRAGVPYRFYTVEVMASRLLGGNLAQAVPNDIEYSWAVDAGVQVAPQQPAANLWITPGNTGAISAIDIVLGGNDYPAVVVATIIDLAGNGTGAAVTFTVVGGVITSYVLTAPGANYVQPEIQLAPSTGDGAVFSLTVSSTCTIFADAAIFTAGNVGQIIRAAGGTVQVVSVTDPQHVVCNVLEPFTQFIPNTAQPASCLTSEWTMGPQITQLPFLDHLEGMEVVGLADGSVIGPLKVTDGAIALPNPASIVTAGLGFTAQIKTLRLDLGNQGGGTVQGKRKKISAVTLRVQDTQGLMVGSTWDRMTPIKPSGYAPSNSAVPFSQGGGNQDAAVNGIYGQQTVTYLDQRIIMDPSWNPDGQVCIQQSNPLPMSLLAIIPEISVGDS